MDLILRSCESMSVPLRKLLDGDALEDDEHRNLHTHILQCRECSNKIPPDVRKRLELLYLVPCYSPS